MAQLPQAKLVQGVSLTPAPWNPRSINDYDPRFQNLCESLTETRTSFSSVHPGH